MVLWRWVGRISGSLLFLLSPSLWGQEVVEIVEVRSLGGDYTNATDVNDRGRVVGVSRTGEFDDGSPIFRAFVSLAQTDGAAFLSTRDLGALGGLRSTAYGISRSGTVVGSAANGVPEPGRSFFRAFSTRTGTMEDLGPPFEGEDDLFGQTIAISINNQDQIVGNIGVGGFLFGCILTLWLPEAAFGLNAGVNQLEFPPGIGPSGIPTSINNKGQIVGEARRSCDVVGTGNPAFLWLPSPEYGLTAGFHNLTPDLTVGDARATSINNNGVAVGWFDAPAQFGGVRPFSWSNQELRNLPSLPGVEASRPTAINDAGLIVGTTAIDATFVGPFGFDPDSRALIWRDGAVRDLNDLLPPGTPWTLHVASAINNRNQIVGLGSLNGLPSAFRLTLGRAAPTAVPAFSAAWIWTLVVGVLLFGVTQIRSIGNHA